MDHQLRKPHDRRHHHCLRDSDYGVIQNDESYLNDWLGEEFRQRVSKKRSIVVTSRLTDAFKRADVAVTETEEEAERAVVKERQAAPVTSSWGSILFSAEQNIEYAWWLAVFPGLAIFLTVAAFNIIGDRFRDALDPRTD